MDLLPSKALAFWCISVMPRRQYIEANTSGQKRLVLMASFLATLERASCASFPHSLYRECTSHPAQQYNLRSCSLPIELSGLMTFRSNAAECERDQLGTNTSAGRVLSFVEVSPQPLSSSGARQALRQKPAKLSRRRLCLVTTSPPAWHIRAWCPWMSRVWEQCGQASASVKTGSPSHHFTKAWTSLGSRSNPNFGDGCALSHACAWGAEMASSLALSTVDAPSSKERKPAFSMAEDSNDIHEYIHVQYRHIMAILFILNFNESTVLLTNTTNKPTVPLTYPWTASLPMMALATDLTRDMLRRL